MFPFKTLATYKKERFSAALNVFIPLTCLPIDTILSDLLWFRAPWPFVDYILSKPEVSRELPM